MRTIKWGRLAEILKSKGVRIEDHGSEKKLIQQFAGGTRLYILQHECCRSKNADVWATHLSRIKAKFGISERELRG